MYPTKWHTKRLFGGTDLVVVFASYRVDGEYEYLQAVCNTHGNASVLWGIKYLDRKLKEIENIRKRR